MAEVQRSSTEGESWDARLHAKGSSVTLRLCIEVFPCTSLEPASLCMCKHSQLVKGADELLPVLQPTQQQKVWLPMASTNTSCLLAKPKSPPYTLSNFTS